MDLWLWNTFWSAENFKRAEQVPKKEHGVTPRFPCAGRSSEQPIATKWPTNHGANAQRWNLKIILQGQQRVALHRSCVNLLGKVSITAHNNTKYLQNNRRWLVVFRRWWVTCILPMGDAQLPFKQTGRHVVPKEIDRRQTTDMQPDSWTEIRVAEWHYGPVAGQPTHPPQI